MVAVGICAQCMDALDQNDPLLHCRGAGDRKVTVPGKIGGFFCTCACRELKDSQEGS